MAKDILMPQMGYDMTEGTIVRWLKKVGDKVNRGDIVAEIETDKATVEIEAFDSGTMLRTLAESGDTVPVGQPIATLGEKGES
ncbi:MAG: biotin/lipoyl-containing protein, partial [Candidatus Dormiibacterota bacterium]